jgi:hypothetical protein
MKLPRHTAVRRTLTLRGTTGSIQNALLVLLFRCNTVSDLLFNALRSFVGRPTTAGTKQASLENTCISHSPESPSFLRVRGVYTI